MWKKNVKNKKLFNEFMKSMERLGFTEDMIVTYEEMKLKNGELSNFVKLNNGKFFTKTISNKGLK